MSRRRRIEAALAQDALLRRRRSVGHRTLRRAVAARAQGRPAREPRLLAMPPLAVSAPAVESLPAVEEIEESLASVVEEADDATIAIATLADDGGEAEEADEAAESADDGDEQLLDEEPEAEPDLAATAVLPPVAEAEPEPIAEPAGRYVFDDAIDAPASDHPAPAAASAPQRTRGKAGIVTAAVIAGLAIAYVGAQYWAGTAAPAGTIFLGEDLSGMPADQVRASIRDDAALLNSVDIALLADDKHALIAPADAGLHFDAEASANRIVGFSLDPSRLWARITGGGEVEPVVAIDQDRLHAAVVAAAAELDQEAIEAVVTMSGPRVSVTDGQARIAVDVPLTASAIADLWPSRQEIEAVAAIDQPALTTAEARRFEDAMNGHVFAADVTLTSPNGDVTLTPEQLAEYTGFVLQEDGRLALTVDGARLAADLREDRPELENAPRNASITFDAAHQLVVDAGAPGRTIDDASIEEAVVAAASGISRSAAIPFIEVDPEITAEKLDIEDFKVRVSEFSTPLTPRERKREINIANAAARMTGTIVAPGEIFSLGDAIGPVTPANGYIEAGVIVNNEHADGMGGGLSQVATTTYNAAYFGGYEDVQHRPHSEWFTRYPAGREATIYLPDLDMKFRNDTPYSLIINAYVESARLHVDIWSTPYYTVETTSSGKYNVREGGHVVKPAGPDCTRESAKQGFTITNTRYVYLNGELVKEEPYTWTYRAVPSVTCE